LQEATPDLDEEQATWPPFFAAWHAHYGVRELTLGDIEAVLTDEARISTPRDEQRTARALLLATPEWLRVDLGRPGSPFALRLGKQLTRRKGRRWPHPSDPAARILVVGYRRSGTGRWW